MTPSNRVRQDLEDDRIISHTKEPLDEEDDDYADIEHDFDN